MDENSVLGARGAAAEINYAFLPVTRLQSYFDRRQLSKLLGVLFKDDVPPDHRILRENDSKVFCILLYIGKREYIEHFMQHESLNDQRLPFDPQRPTHFPRDPNDQEFFSKRSACFAYQSSTTTSLRSSRKTVSYPSPKNAESMPEVARRSIE